jgi:hypothetical protein
MQVNVNDLTSGMTVVLYGHEYVYDHTEYGPRGDSRWLVMSNGYKTHRWQRESVEVKTATEHDFDPKTQLCRNCGMNVRGPIVNCPRKR